MKYLIFSVCAVFFLFNIAIAEDSCRKDGKIVVCYYASWAIYRLGAGNMNISQIDPELCTHLVYTFAGLDIIENRIVSLDPWNDLSTNGGKDSYNLFVKLKEKKPCLKILLALGGWNEIPKKYSIMANTSESRKEFATSIVRYLAQYNFDGLDLDWEYPTQRGGIPQDKNNFVALLQEVKYQLRPWNFLLTVAVAVTDNVVSEAYDIKAISQIVDYISLMAYDYTSPTSQTTGLLSPLKSNNPNDIEKSVNLWIKGGCPADKLVLGIPMYARSFKLKNPEKCTTEVNCGIGIETTGNNMAGRFTKEIGFLANYELAELLKRFKYTSKLLINEQNYFAYNGTFWITYDDEKTITEKVKFAKSKNLKGIMAWSIDTDDFRPMFSKTRYPLLQAINKALDTTY